MLAAGRGVPRARHLPAVRIGHRLGTGSSVSVPSSGSPSPFSACFPQDSGCLHRSLGHPWRLETFFSQHWNVAVDDGERSQYGAGEELPGREGLSCGVSVDGSGTTTIHPFASSLGHTELGALPGAPRTRGR